MKKYLIILISLIVCSTCIAQPICDDMIIKTDAFTKETVKKISVKMSSNINNARSVTIYTYDDVSYTFVIVYKSHDFISVSKGDKVMVMVQDSVVLDFEIKFDDMSELVLDDMIVGVYFHANKGDVISLGHRKWTGVRFYTDNGYEEFEIKEKNAIELSGAINCMLKK